jgi:hypothetical protein
MGAFKMPIKALLEKSEKLKHYAKIFEGRI